MNISLVLISSILPSFSIAGCLPSTGTPWYFGVLRGYHTHALKFIQCGKDLDLIFCSSFVSAAKAKITVKLCLTISSSGLHPTGKRFLYCALNSLIGYCSHLHAPSVPPLGPVPWTGIAHVAAPEVGLQCHSSLWRTLWSPLWSPWTPKVRLHSQQRQTGKPLLSLLFYFVLCASKPQRVLDKLILSILIIDPLLLKSIQV